MKTKATSPRRSFPVGKPWSSAEPRRRLGLNKEALPSCIVGAWLTGSVMVMPPNLEYLLNACVEILTKLVDPKAHDSPSCPLQLDVTPHIIPPSGAVRVTMKLVSVNFYVELETGFLLPDEG